MGSDRKGTTDKRKKASEKSLTAVLNTANFSATRMHCVLMFLYIKEKKNFKLFGSGNELIQFTGEEKGQLCDTIRDLYREEIFPAVANFGTWGRDAELPPFSDLRDKCNAFIFTLSVSLVSSLPPALASRAKLCVPLYNTSSVL